MLLLIQLNKERKVCQFSFLPFFVFAYDDDNKFQAEFNLILIWCRTKISFLGHYFSFHELLSIEM